jgi:hypothetical protein
VKAISQLALFGLAALAPIASAVAQEAGSGSSSADRSARRQVRAIPIEGSPPVVDGRLDEGVWVAAPAASGFVQKQPEEGAPALDDTEVRFLYDDRALYVGARMHKRDPATIRAPMGRRDGGFQAEVILVAIDAYLDRRTAYSFGVTSSGVRVDHAQPHDVEVPFDASFDPVYEAKARIDSLGWTAEFRIPFSQLRFLDRPVQVWGINLNRWVPDRSEDSFWVMIPPSETGWASRFGELHGIEGIEPSRRIELLPYVATAAKMRSEIDETDPFAEENDFELRAGADLKMGLGPNLTLEATVNPDFGQVEADPAEVNLTAFETFFPEKRPFFLESADLFQPPGPGWFYSRRLGASPRGSTDADFADVPDNTTIVTATKVTGRLASGLSVAGLTALTSSETARTFDATSGTFDTVEVEPWTGYGVARLQQEFGPDASTAGVILTAVRRDFGEPELAALLARQALTGGADWNLRYRGGEVRTGGHIGFSHVTGEPAAILELQTSSARYYQRPDADHVEVDPSRTSLSGWTAGVDVSREGGTHWLWEAVLTAESPGLELNDVGRLVSADNVFGLANLRYRETRPAGPLQNWEVGLTTENSWNLDGIRTFSALRTDSRLTFRNFWEANLTAWMDFRSLSDDLTRGGPLMGTGHAWVGIASLGNSFSASTRWRARVFYGENELGERTYRLSGGFSFRPAPRWQLSIDPNYLNTIDPRQYVTTLAEGRPETYGSRYVFAFVDRTTLLAQIRLNYAITPDMTLELYAEPFAASGRFYDFGELEDAQSRNLRVYGEAPDTTIEHLGEGVYEVTDGGEAFTFERSDFNVRSFRSNLVLRWEWLRGSTLFLVWQQDRASSSTDGDHVGMGDLWETLEASGDQFFALKATYWLPID